MKCHNYGKGRKKKMLEPWDVLVYPKRSPLTDWDEFFRSRNCIEELDSLQLIQWTHLNPPGNKHSSALSFELVRGEERLFGFRCICRRLEAKIFIYCFMTEQFSRLTANNNMIPLDTIFHWEMPGNSGKKTRFGCDSVWIRLRSMTCMFESVE